MDYWLCLLGFFRVVFCVPGMPYAVRPDNATFDDALNTCMTDGFLTDMDTPEEASKIFKVLISDQALSGNGTYHFWIGLKKAKRRCVEQHLPLKGFRWTVDDSDRSSGEVLWKIPPTPTCTGILCGVLSVDYDGTAVVSWGLDSSSCRAKYPFICKRKQQDVEIDRKRCPKPRIPDTHDLIYRQDNPDAVQVICGTGQNFTLTCSRATQEWTVVGELYKEVTGLCLVCQPGYTKNFRNCVDVDECQRNPCKGVCFNTEGSYQCKCKDDQGNYHNEDSASCTPEPTGFPGGGDTHFDPGHAVTRQPMVMENPSLLSSTPAKPTSPQDAVTIEDNRADHANIFMPVLIAVMALVVLVVVVLVIVKCCLRQRSKKLAIKRAEASKETVALKTADSMEKVNEKEAT